MVEKHGEKRRTSTLSSFSFTKPSYPAWTKQEIINMDGKVYLTNHIT